MSDDELKDQIKMLEEKIDELSKARPLRLIETILKACHEGRKVGFEEDWGGPRLTVFEDGAHTHVGGWYSCDNDAITPERLFDLETSVCNVLNREGGGLSWAKPSDKGGEMSHPIRCVGCGSVTDERTGEKLHPDRVIPVSAWTCDSCRERINESVKKEYLRQRKEGFEG